MKKFIAFLSAFMLIVSIGFSQTPMRIIRLADASTQFGINTPIGTLVFNVADGHLYTVTAPITSTSTISSSSGSLALVNGDGQTDLAEANPTTTTVQITSSTGDAATLHVATTSRAGLLPAQKFIDIETNNAKVTNATHTGDVTGSLALTIGNDKVRDNHIDWGSSAGQVNTSDLPEGTNLWYTEARVSANASVAANTAKISYTDASAVASNTAHRTTTSGNPHEVTKADVGLGNVPNTDFTSAVAANTAKVGITAQQAADITANNAKVSNVPTQLSLGTRTSTTMGITTDGGANDVIVPAATSSQAGLLTGAQYDLLESLESGAEPNYTLYTESFSEDDGTPTVHTLEFTAQTAGAIVSINGAVLGEDQYTLTSTTLTMGVPVLQYDRVTITYNY